MGLHIGVISVKGHKYHPTRRLMEAAATRGHTVSRIHPYRFWPAFNNQGKTAFLRAMKGKCRMRYCHARGPMWGLPVWP